MEQDQEVKVPEPDAVWEDAVTGIIHTSTLQTMHSHTLLQVILTIEGIIHPEIGLWGGYPPCSPDLEHISDMDMAVVVEVEVSDTVEAEEEAMVAVAVMEEAVMGEDGERR